MMMTGMNDGNSGVWRVDSGAGQMPESVARYSVGGLMLLCWVLFALAMLSGCVTQSVHPIYSEDTLTFDERLIGTFQQEDGVWTFTQAGRQSYEAVFVDENGVSASFDVHLARINDTVFLDLHADEWPDDGSEMLEMTLLPLHWFFRVDEIGDSLKISAMNEEWLADYLTDFPELVEHTVVDDRVLLTDRTERLQAFISAQVHNAEAWEDAGEFRRLPETRR